MQTKWIKRIGIAALVGGLCLVGYGPALAAPPVKEDALAGVTQNWDKNLPSSTRFTVLSAFAGAAVRDNNTGLVWEQAPDTTLRVWLQRTAPLGATNYCLNKTVGGTRGWRLPSVVELASLIDPALAAPFISEGVFNNVGLSGVLLDFWSATTFESNTTLAWVMGFRVGDVFDSGKTTGSFRAWCVRGPMNADAY